MRNLDILMKEIVELNAIKSAYNHYLGSYRSLTEVENTTSVRRNRVATISSIRLLYAAIVEEKQAIIQDIGRPSCIKTVHHTKTEQNAILHFNRDRRFTITE
jgi:hypothetical protein